MKKVNKTIFLGKLHPVAIGVFLAFLAVKGVHAEENVEFNTDVLDIKERNNVDLSQFSRAGYLMPGKYQLTLKVNKTDIPDQTVEYFPPEDDPKGSEVCLTAEPKDDGVYLSLSVPWSNGATLSYNGQYSGDSSSNTVGYYQRINANNYYQVNAGSTTDGRGTGSGYFTHDGDSASVTANASYTGSKSSAAGLSLQGGVTATAKGAALHRTNSAGGTRMLVDTAGVEDVPVQGMAGIVRTNAFGKAVVADVSSYYRSSVSVDLDSLPENVDATRSVVQDTLTEGAIGYRAFGILAGQKGMAVIKLADGSEPPFGAEVRNGDNMTTGIVAENGSVWLSGMRPGERMDVYWGNDAQCYIELPPSLPETINNLLLPCLSR
ncbi:fimbria/pilus outer membrane usher protein [Enterobacter dykesii]|uniref:fimbria/pilus outer membrane usher protein n=1 Tax=Enterobacter dykesii TaxID=2797506 RepID=UPI0032B58D1A